MNEKLFPSNFNPEIYKKNNKDLIDFNGAQLSLHYENYGLAEGRVASQIASRKELVAHISNLNFSSCLEIGPFDCPILVGGNVKYFDVLSQEELIHRAKEIGRVEKLHNIPIIEFVSKEGCLKTVNQKFDLILSCHVIEHQIDFIQHLNDVSDLLHENGYYVVICPDKRYCFDHFIPESNIAELISTHNIPSNSHSIKSVIEHRALTCHNDPSRHWAGDHGDSDIDAERIRGAINEYEKAKIENKYIDVHSLQFTPSSFQKNINLLFKLKYINLLEEEIYPTIKNNFEFFAVLKKALN
jgi:hypothetical protein